MGWSYNVSLIYNYGKDYIRFLVGDTQTTDQQLQDEEILATMATRSTPYGAAAELCLALSTKFSRMVDQSAGSFKIAYSNMAKAYASRALQYEQKAALEGSGNPYAGGISIADMQSQEGNSDRVNPIFTIGMDDNTSPDPSSGPETEDMVTSRSQNQNP